METEIDMLDKNMDIDSNSEKKKQAVNNDLEDIKRIET